MLNVYRAQGYRPAKLLLLCRQVLMQYYSCNLLRNTHIAQHVVFVLHSSTKAIQRKEVVENII